MRTTRDLKWWTTYFTIYTQNSHYIKNAQLQCLKFGRGQNSIRGFESRHHLSSSRGETFFQFKYLKRYYWSNDFRIRVSEISIVCFSIINFRLEGAYNNKFFFWYSFFLFKTKNLENSAFEEVKCNKMSTLNI